MPFENLLSIEMRVLQEELNFFFGQVRGALLRFRCVRAHGVALFDLRFGFDEDFRRANAACDRELQSRSAGNQPKENEREILSESTRRRRSRERTSSRRASHLFVSTILSCLCPM